MLILNPCPSWELQEMFNTCRKKRRDKTAGQKDQYRAEWYGPQDKKTSKQDQSLAERSEDNQSQTEGNLCLKKENAIRSLP